MHSPRLLTPILFFLFSAHAIGQNKNRHTWKIKFASGYEFAGMAGGAAKTTTVLDISSAFVYNRTTNIQAGKKFQGNYFFRGGVSKKINRLADIGISAGISNWGGYAQIDKYNSWFQFRNPGFKSVQGKGKDVFNFRYLVIPLSIYLHPIRQHNFCLLMQGFYANLKCSEEIVTFKSSTGNPEDNAGYIVNNYENYKHQNWGAAIGVGYEWPLMKHLDLSTEVSFSKGFTNITEKKIYSQSPSSTQYLSAGIALGFSF